MAPLAATTPLETQLDFLCWLHWIWAGFNAAVGLAMGATGLAAMILSGAGPAVADVAAGVTGGAFLVVSLAAAAWAAAHAWCARALQRRLRWGRTAALVLAPFDVLLFPLGTLLAAYTIWLLLQGAGRERFEMA